jgi:hypothetical protein
MLQNNLHSSFTPREIYNLPGAVPAVKDKGEKGYY